jgi:hypothetical protein
LESRCGGTIPGTCSAPTSSTSIDTITSHSLDLYHVSAVVITHRRAL